MANLQLYEESMPAATLKPAQEMMAPVGGKLQRAFRENPVRVAWITMISAFVVFCFLLITIPLAARLYVLYATAPLSIELNVLEGAVLVTVPQTNSTQAIVGRALIDEKTRVSTDENANAILTIYANDQRDEALASITLYNTATVTFDQGRAPRFSYSSEADQLTVFLERGRIRVSPSHRAERALNVTVRTPHGEIKLADGSYSIDVRNEESQIATRAGQALIVAAGQQVQVGAGLRSRIAAGQPPQSPTSVEQNLLQNANFNSNLDGWDVKSFVDVREDAIKEVGTGSAKSVLREGRKAVLFERRGREGVHAETEIRQILNVDVRDFDSLNVAFNVQVQYQSLPGAGMQSSEFPMAVQINYNDIYGTERLWTAGFYYLDLDASRPWPLRNVQKIPQSTWYAYESPNLIELLKETRPSHLNWIRFYASGYNYESLVSDPALLAR